MGVKVRVKKNIGKDSEEYFGKPNGKVYELTDNFRLVDDDGHEWGRNGFKDEQEFIEYMKNVHGSSTEFEVVREKSKWKCVELNKTSGFTEGKVYEVEGNGTIYYDDGNPCTLDTFKINGNKAECWNAKFEKVEDGEKVKLKVGDRVIVNGEKTGLEFNNDKGKIVDINRCGDIGVEFDTKRNIVLHSCKHNGKRNSCWYVDKDMVTVYKEVEKEEEKVVNKFKVGDVVKGKIGSKTRYAITNEYMTRGEVVNVNDNDEIKVKVLEHSTAKKGEVFWVDKELFELVTPPKKSIHLTFDGTTTHAVVKEDGKVVKREKVGLYRGDVYDEATGVREVINKLYGKRVVEDVKPKFIKAKVGDTIKIVNAKNNHFPDVKNGDIAVIKKVLDCEVQSDINGFYDSAEEYIIINNRKPISEYTTDELLSEIKKRMEK